ncbi:cytochrome c oxidase assembly protein [Sporosarcina sp. 179-K 3D1 HS]|uniref:cytochrome c oxidase assembly protein n=1 Tax=Sporosarcina sp. 179-K 3D1 HS TaxID=3232169 RepID=UPI0039A2486F
MPHDPFTWTFTDWFFGIPAMLAMVLYVAAVYTSNRRGRLRPWPWHRTLFWFLGVLTAAVALVGPLSHRSHENFVAHMVGHLLVGMLGPLLIVLAAPMTLLLRTLPVRAARNVSRLLKSPVARLFTHPIVASLLNIGGLWLLYVTPLYHAMHSHVWLHILIHIHVFAAGYLFTISMLYIDPVAHRLSYRYRTIVFIFALAGHGILSKFIYAYPPVGVPVEHARPGAMFMYYGGDAVDLIIIILLFHQWYRSIRFPRTVPATLQ